MFTEVIEMEHWTKMGVTNVPPTFCSFDIEEGMFYKFFSSGTLHNSTPLLNPFVPNAPLLYPLKTSKNLTVFWCFEGVEKGWIGNKWVNMETKSKYTFTPFQNCLSRKTNARELLASSCLCKKIMQDLIVTPNK